jgi:hypothetical protein
MILDGCSVRSRRRAAVEARVGDRAEPPSPHDEAQEEAMKLTWTCRELWLGGIKVADILEDGRMWTYAISGQGRTMLYATIDAAKEACERHVKDTLRAIGVTT